jgi:hypothetical protein
MLPLGPAALAALRVISAAKAARTTGGIVGAGSKAVDPAFKNMTNTIQNNSVKVAKTQAQINAEGAAKARAALGLPPKPTVQEIAARASRENASLTKSRIKKGK